MVHPQNQFKQTDIKGCEAVQVFKETGFNLANEIQALSERIESLEDEKCILMRNIELNKPRNNLGSIDYSKERVVGGLYPEKLEHALRKLIEIDSSIDEAAGILKKKQEAYERIKALLKKLQGTKYQVAYKRFFEGKSHKEIAEEMDCSIQTVKNIATMINKEMK